MAFQLAPFRPIPLAEELLEHLIREHETCRLPRLLRLWSYYRNALGEPTASGGSATPPAQMVGLPDRLASADRLRPDQRLRREIVIENDIAWRINALVDFMFPEPPRIISQAADVATRQAIETLLDAVITASGGIALWQNAALLAAVYGSVDFLLLTDALATVRPTEIPRANGADHDGAAPDGGLRNLAARVSQAIGIEAVEAPRAIPLVNPRDYRLLDAYIVHFARPVHEISRRGMFARLSDAVTHRCSPTTQRRTVTVTVIRSASAAQRYEDGRLVQESTNRLGRMPVIHVQNLSQPLAFDGLSDVEPLIPLQDELNTRLSDRANRVTMQSFRMWLGKGIEGFIERPVGPGQMWVTDNPEASIESFGGDADSPSERAHIEELREALDKASGVTPSAAGHIRARIGNLTSENALRISLMGTIAKTKRKRITFEAGIQALCELILYALDVYGVYPTEPGDRKVSLAWADPLPPDMSRRINDAVAKAELGVPLTTLRAELGYADAAEA